MSAVSGRGHGSPKGQPQLAPWLRLAKGLQPKGQAGTDSPAPALTGRVDVIGSVLEGLPLIFLQGAATARADSAYGPNAAGRRAQQIDTTRERLLGVGRQKTSEGRPSVHQAMGAPTLVRAMLAGSSQY